MLDSFTVGDVLYHAVHGVCKVTEVRNEETKSNTAYVLQPSQSHHGKFRYVIEAASLPLSGFHSPVTSEEAERILTYFRRGYAETPTGVPPAKENHLVPDETRTWALAECLLKSSQDTAFASAQRKRNMLARAARGLAFEFALALNISPKEAAARIQNCLQRSTEVSPLVVKALENCLDEPHPIR